MYKIIIKLLIIIIYNNYYYNLQIPSLLKYSQTRNRFMNITVLTAHLRCSDTCSSLLTRKRGLPSAPTLERVIAATNSTVSMELQRRRLKHRPHPFSTNLT